MKTAKRVRLAIGMGCAAAAGLFGTALIRSGTASSDTQNNTTPALMTHAQNTGRTDRPSDMPSERTPTGATFPGCWKHVFDVPKKITANSDFLVTISVTATLFDVEDLEIVPAASGSLTCVKGPAWKGTLKKGETRDMALTLRATTTGFNGAYGLIVRAPKFYDEVLAYVNAQQSGPYATQAAKDSIAEQVGFMRQSQPLHEEWVGSSITVNERGEVKE